MLTHRLCTGLNSMRQLQRVLNCIVCVYSSSHEAKLPRPLNGRGVVVVV